MQVFLRSLGGQTRTLSFSPDDTVAQLSRAVHASEGIPPQNQRLLCGGVQLNKGSATLASAGIHAESTIQLLLRLRGGGSSKVALTVQPRVQKEKWSLYWKESMSTKTDCLDAFQLEVEPNTTIAEVQIMTAKRCGWAPVEGLTRLEGFQEPWEKVVYKGREVKPDQTVEAAGLAAGAVLTTVRKALVAEGWKMVKEGEEEDDLTSTDEEDDF